MVTEIDILNYVLAQPETLQQTFQSLVNSNNPTTKQALVRTQEVVKQALVRSGVEVLPTKNWLVKVANDISIEDLVNILSEDMRKAEQKLSSKLIEALFGSMLRKMLEKMTELDLSNLSTEQKHQVEVALYLASVYVGLE